ncbi:protein of unknown function [Poseidonocella sedimentorum]|uniref:DUF4167 domain-containing protein n=2 Tax=Poseidonocella sedimentorum TaxID=871652 RepID=A0A1I6DZ74_9RHOB|nr:protein of unknown function [Poseidonocella sedimentorum]
MGNIVNRVFDSSGPEGKVRGTPQQIIEKYNQLARDAQLSNDRVAAENFQQHAEHYLRMLAEATREQDTRREEQERHNRERQAERDRERSGRQDRDNTSAPDPATAPQPDVIDTGDSDGDSGLVETPEAAKPRARKPRARKPKPESQPTEAKAETPAETPAEPKAEKPAKAEPSAEAKTPDAAE